MFLFVLWVCLFIICPPILVYLVLVGLSTNEPVFHGLGMGARRHGQEGHLPPPSGNVVKCFCALVVTGKRSVDELFMHYFHNLSSASVGFAPRGPDQPGLHPGTPGKSPAGVHWAGCMLTHSFVLKY